MGELNEQRTISRGCQIFPKQTGIPCIQWLSGKESAGNAETQEMQDRSLGQEDPLEGSRASHSSILAWRIPIERRLMGYSPGITESDKNEVMAQAYHVFKDIHINSSTHFDSLERALVRLQ